VLPKLSRPRAPIALIGSEGQPQALFAESFPLWRVVCFGDFVDRRYAGPYSVAGAVNLLPPIGGRFDEYPYPFTTPADTPPGAQPAFPQIKTAGAAFQSWALPSDRWANSTEGVRLHTLVENIEMTAFYWHAHRLDATNFVDGAPKCGQVLQFRYPQINDIGTTMNRPIYLESSLLSGLPLVIRSEAEWQDRTPFDTINPFRRSIQMNAEMTFGSSQGQWSRAAQTAHRRRFGRASDWRQARNR
jgi:hypothetical protein